MTHSHGEAMAVMGQSVDANGITWYQTEMGWVCSAVVTVSGDCSGVPVVNP